ncbi:uncharacterized protein F4812DRAFT_409312 [Daldinia caldariorum]|uniref:uncharacterized protein n=1 Tax=Daldinia caldariorum TaxID=326644 RepID=UPI002008E84F|nr:uncharacterized protein F4812DRAFT_409312 [Daldinia caldariorum]KAI1472537.1 hypothetical protein F4812DRAFT_409312 [Daldinia caldariorum]
MNTMVMAIATAMVKKKRGEGVTVVVMRAFLISTAIQSFLSFHLHTRSTKLEGSLTLSLFVYLPSIIITLCTILLYLLSNYGNVV